MPRHPDQLRELIEAYLEELVPTPALGTLAEPMVYALGGKRVRPVLCLATGDAVGAPVEELLPAAAAVELVHSFSLVHDDLPSMDDDAERRGQPSVWAQFGQAAALLAGDALLTEAFRLALTYPTTAVASELCAATLEMIGGQWRELDGDGTREEIHRLKTGGLFRASIGCALAAMEMPLEQQVPWRAFAEELGMLFQVVDDILDGDGFVVDLGEEGARHLADGAAERAQGRLAEIDAETSVLAEIVAGLQSRTA